MGNARASRRHPERHKPKYDVMVGYCRGDHVMGMFMDNLLELFVYDFTHDQRIGYRFSVATSRLTTDRNTICKIFLGRTNCEWLYFLDTDMGLQPDILDQSMKVLAENPEVKILGGLAFTGGRSWSLTPTIYTEDMRDKGFTFARPDYPKNALMKVGRTGAACLLIHRSVLIDMGRLRPKAACPWFWDEDRDGNSIGEDVVFCERAREAGHDVWVHSGLKYGHMKVSPLYEATFDWQQTLSEQEKKHFSAAHDEAMGLVER